MRMVSVVLGNPPAKAQPDERVPHDEAEQAIAPARAEYLDVPRIMADEAQLGEHHPHQRGDGESRPRVADDDEQGPPGEEGEEFYDEKDLPGANDPASFINFLMSLATNAAAALGMMPHPGTGESGVDLELAKHWIDVLGMLRQKTRGNLAPQEDQMFEGILADLRMQYVSLTSGPAAPPKFSASDITGGR